jgi:hypothetical protein
MSISENLEGWVGRITSARWRARIHGLKKNEMRIKVSTMNMYSTTRKKVTFEIQGRREKIHSTSISNPTSPMIPQTASTLYPQPPHSPSPTEQH